MHDSRSLVGVLVGVALGVGLAAPLAVGQMVATNATAQAAPANYAAGMRLRARSACTINGYAIKAGVVLTVVAVHVGEDKQPRALDLSFSGMTITDVAVADVAAHFVRA